jgi:hypothetical protein
VKYLEKYPSYCEVQWVTICVVYMACVSWVLSGRNVSIWEVVAHGYTPLFWHPLFSHRIVLTRTANKPWCHRWKEQGRNSTGIGIRVGSIFRDPTQPTDVVIRPDPWHLKNPWPQPSDYQVSVMFGKIVCTVWPDPRNLGTFSTRPNPQMDPTRVQLWSK